MQVAPGSHTLQIKSGRLVSPERPFDAHDGLVTTHGVGSSSRRRAVPLYRLCPRRCARDD